MARQSSDLPGGQVPASNSSSADFPGILPVRRHSRNLLSGDRRLRSAAIMASLKLDPEGDAYRKVLGFTFRQLDAPTLAASRRCSALFMLRDRCSTC